MKHLLVALLALSPFFIADAASRIYYDSIICGSYQPIRSYTSNGIKMYEFDNEGRITVYKGTPVADVKRGEYRRPEQITINGNSVYQIEYDDQGRVKSETMNGTPSSVHNTYSYQGNSLTPSQVSVALTLMGMESTIVEKYSNFKFNSRGDCVSRTATEGTKAKPNIIGITYWDKLPKFNSWEWEVTPGRYLYIKDFSEGLAKVSLGPYHGYIDKKGTLVIPALTRFAWDQGDFHCGLAYVTDDKRLGYIDKTGRLVIPATYKRLNDYPYGHNFVDGLVIVNTRSGLTFIDTSNRQLFTPNSHGWLSHFSDGIAYTGKGYIDRSGYFVYPFENNMTGSYYCEAGLVTIKKNAGAQKDKIHALADKTGKLLTPFDYEDMKLFDNPRFAAAKKNGKWGVISTSGETAVPFEYDAYDRGRKGAVTLVKEGRAYIFDREMNPSPMSFPKGSTWIIGDDRAAFKDPATGLTGLMDLRGNILHPAEYDFIGYESEGFIGFHRNRKAGYMDRSGAVVIPPVYDLVFGKWVQEFHDGMAVVCVDGHFGVISAAHHAGSPQKTAAPAAAKPRPAAAKRASRPRRFR